MKLRVSDGAVGGSLYSEEQDRLPAGQTAFGAALEELSRENREVLSVKLDDPRFPAPIYDSVVEIDGVHSLIWSR